MKDAFHVMWSHFKTKSQKSTGMKIIGAESIE